MRKNAIGLFARTLMTSVLIFGAYAQGKSNVAQLGKATPINGQESATFKSESASLEIKNEGYGHRMTDKGDQPFVEIALKSGSETGDMRFFTMKLPQTQVWNQWSITVTKTADEGPPHNQKAPTDFVVTFTK